MNPSVLIDLVVSQLTVLIAQIATHSGMRVPLARVADEVFSNLVRQLQEQGVPQKVIADMFGLALRGYQTRVRRLEEQLEEEERTLWMRVLDRVEQDGPICRTDLQASFADADDATLRAVLRDLQETGLVFSSGRRDNPVYIVASDTVRQQLDDELAARSLQDLVAVCLYRGGPQTARDVALRLKADLDDVQDAIDVLLAATRVELVGVDPGASQDGCVQQGGGDPAPRYRARTYRVAAQGAHSGGWEAAVFDHVQAMSATIIQSLAAGGDDERRRVVGGGTYSFDIWPGHPLEADVLDLLERSRRIASEVRQRVQEHNDANGLPAERTRVTFYCGQSRIDGYTDE